MSYILDALKQSEHRRRSSLPPSRPASSPPPAALPRHRRRLLWLLITLLLALPAGYGLGRLGAGWLSASPPAIPAAGPEVHTPVVHTEEPPVISVEPAAPPSPEAVISAGVPRILVDEPPQVKLDEPVAPPAPSGRRLASAPPPAPPAPVVQPAPVFDPGVPDLRTLPVAIRSRLPAMTLSVHIYSPDPAARRAKLNGLMLREGESNGALQLKNITPKGVILGFEGREFHLTSTGG